MQSLEVAWQVSTGQTFWLGVFDQLMLSIFTALSDITRLRNNQLSSGSIHRCHAILSLIISVLTGLTFCFGVLRFVSWFTFMIMGAITGVLTAYGSHANMDDCARRHMTTLSPLLKYQDASENLMSAEVAIDLPSVGDGSSSV